MTPKKAVLACAIVTLAITAIISLTVVFMSSSDDAAGRKLAVVHPLKLQAYQGEPHSYKVIQDKERKQGQGVPKRLLSGRTEDGGTVSYAPSGDVASWTSSDGAVARTFTYTDLPSQFKQVPIPGVQLYVGAGGGLSQILGDPEQGFASIAISKQQFQADHRIQHILLRVEDNRGRFWTRDPASGLMEEFRSNADGQPESSGKFASDGQLIPRTILSADENRLYADALHPEKSVSAYGINQGLLGDCYFESTLASLAKQHPEAIISMIENNHDGTFTVNFPRTANSDALMQKRVAMGTAAPELEAGVAVRVEAPTQAEIDAFNRTRWQVPSFLKLQPTAVIPKEGPSLGYWATVIEKAHRYLTGKVTGDTGDNPRLAMMLLTGVTEGTSNYVNFRQNNQYSPTPEAMKKHPDATWAGESSLYSDGELAERIKTALAQGKIVVASTAADGNAWVRTASNTKGPSEDLYLLPNHAYTVTGYLPGTAGRLPQVILRTPQGMVTTIDSSVHMHLLGGQDADGYFQVSIADFTKLFGSLNVGG